MITLGLDLALGVTGWAHVAYEDGALLASGLISPDTSLPLIDRLNFVAHKVGELVTDSVSNIYVEQPISHRSGTTTIRLGMVHGAVLHELYGGPPVNSVNVTQLKAWATKSGRADKTAMIQAAHERFGVWLDHNQADAALIAAFGREQIIAAIESGEPA